MLLGALLTRPAFSCFRFGDSFVTLDFFTSPVWDRFEKERACVGVEGTDGRAEGGCQMTAGNQLWSSCLSVSSTGPRGRERPTP